MVRARRCAKYAAIRICMDIMKYLCVPCWTSSAPSQSRPKRPATQIPAKATTAQSMAFRISLEAVAPMYMPSQVKAAQPIIGIRSNHGRYSRDCSITAASEVMTLSIGTPAK